MNHYFVHFSFLEPIEFLKEMDERIIIKAETEDEAVKSLTDALKSKKYVQVIDVKQIPEPSVDYVTGETSVDLPKKDTLN